MTNRLPVGVLIAGLFPFSALSQTDPRGRSHTLFGTVEGINEFAQSVRVLQEKVKGYSDARAATYKVADAAILNRLEIGDHIAATIYEKDDALYDIRVVTVYDVRPPYPLKR